MRMAIAAIGLALVLASCARSGVPQSGDAPRSGDALAETNGSISQVNPDYARLGQNLEGLALINHEGASVPWSNLTGTPRALFFGFASCPEICPTTLLHLEASIQSAGLGDKAIAVDLVTIDPERDDPQTLKAFVTNYSTVARGWTGAKADIERLARSYRVYFAKHEYEGGYTMDHSTSIYLLGRDGRVLDVVSDDLTVDEIAKRLKAIVRS